MEALNLTGEALRLILDFPVYFIHVDVMIERHEDITFGDVKAVREARVKGLVSSYYAPTYFFGEVESTLGPPRGDYRRGLVQVKLRGTTYYFRGAEVLKVQGPHNPLYRVASADILAPRIF